MPKSPIWVFITPEEEEEEEIYDSTRTVLSTLVDSQSAFNINVPLVKVIYDCSFQFSLTRINKID